MTANDGLSAVESEKRRGQNAGTHDLRIPAGTASPMVDFGTPLPAHRAVWAASPRDLSRFEEVPMPKEPTLKEQTAKVFKETVDIYRADLNALRKNPLPLIIAIAVIVLFVLAIRLV
jgi:hypothetical protein